MAQRTYASFNTLTIAGRVSHAELVTNNGNEFLSVTLLTELKDEAPAIAVTFNTSNGTMALYKKGHLNNGRLVTVTGHLDSFTELYFDKKAGKTKRLQRPKLHLVYAQVLPGGYGPGKKADTAPAVDEDLDIDEAPAIPTKVAVTADGTPVTDF